MTAEQATNTAVYDIKELKPRYGIGGADLSKTTDLTAAKVLFRVPGDEHIYTISMYWIPEDLVERGSKRIMFRMMSGSKRDMSRTCPGNKISYKTVRAWFWEIQNKYRYLHV